MNKTLSRCVDRVLEDDSIEALYIYSSYVNGYYRKDSDIDLVGLTSHKNAKKIKRPDQATTIFVLNLVA